MSTMVNKYDALKNNEESGEEDNGGRDLKEMEKPLPPVEVKPGDHRLQFTYNIWFSRRAPGKQATTQNYDQNLKLIGRFASVEQFWAYYSRLVRPADLNSHSDIHIFKDGIKPMWEDAANKNGGKWIVRLRKGLASRCWENMILAMLGEQFMVGDEICGAVISVRFQEDIISVWNRTAQDTATTTRIRDTLKRVLNLPPNHRHGIQGLTMTHSKITPASATPGRTATPTELTPSRDKVVWLPSDSPASRLRPPPHSLYT